MVTPAAAKISTTKKLLAVMILVACFCVPFTETMVFTTEEDQVPKSPGQEQISKNLSGIGQVSDDSLHPTPKPERSAANTVPGAQKHASTSVAQRDRPIPEIPSEKSVASLPVYGGTKNPARNMSVREESFREKPATEIVETNPIQISQISLEHPQRKPVENKGIKKNSPDNYVVSDFNEVVRGQKIYAVGTPKTRYACCVPPKNGCTYHIGLLHRIVGIEDYEAPYVVHDKGLKADLSMERFSHEEIGDWLENDSIPKYFIVRNPVMRTLSAYLDKVEPAELSPTEPVDDFENWIMQEFPKGRMLLASTSGKRLKMNPHWMPQTEFCGVKSNLFKKFRVFRFEEPEEYLKYMYEFVPREFLDDGWRGKDNVSLKEFILGPKKRTSGTTDKFAKYFRSLEVFDHLVRELRGDIETFGYEKDVALLRKKVILNQKNPSN